MRGVLLFLLAGAALSAAETRKIELPDGSAEFEWVDGGTFRVVRSWSAGAAAKAQPDLVLESAHLKVEIDGATLAMNVKTASGKPLASIAGPARKAGQIVLETRLDPAERIYGHTGASAEPPFVFSTGGYGERVAGGSIRYRVDVEPERLRVTAEGGDKLEYLFFYGPAPKEIFEQRKTAVPIPEKLPLRMLDLEHLNCEGIRQLNAESLAATFYVVNAGPRWETFLGAYMREIHDRGLPVFRPLALQFPKDANASKQMAVTMLGDEILIAPKCAGPLTLPQGLWTDLKTNVEHKGRTTVELTDAVTLLARNGTIVPLRLPDRVELHYFPRLGAEFFLYEPELAEYSQVHASPAGDFWRLEIESKVSRKYEWVLHHLSDPPKRIVVDAKAGADHILNLPM